MKGDVLIDNSTYFCYYQRTTKKDGNMEEIKLIRWPRLVIGVITLLFAGIIYAWSILNAPFESVWDATQLGINYTLTVIFFCLGGFFSGLLSKKVSSTKRLMASGLLLFAGFFITSNLLGGGSVIWLYLAYGVLAGTGIGIAYNTVIGTVNAWFPDRQGLCSGVLLMGFGLSSLIIGQIADMMGRSELIGWRSTYVIFAVSIGVVLLVASLFIKLPPEGMVFPESKDARKSKPPGSGGVDYAAPQMIRRASFIKLFIFSMLIAATGSAAIGFARDIVTEAGASVRVAVATVGMLSVFNGVGRLVSGWLFDNIGKRKTQYVIATVGIMGPAVVVLALITDSLILSIIGVCLCGFAFGLGPTMSSVFVADFYGLKNFSLNFSIVNLLLIPAPFAATLAGFFKDSTDSFIIAFTILLALSIVGFFVNVSLRKA